MTYYSKMKKSKRHMTKRRLTRCKRPIKKQGGGSKELSKDELAFVSCFYGDDKNEGYKVPPLPSENYNCYFLTNNPKILELARKDKWIGVLDNKNKPITDNDYLSSMYSKEIKAAPHHFPFLKDYTYLVYLDSKLPKISVNNIHKLIDKYLVKEPYAILLRKHQLNKDNFIWTEFNESMKQERYKLHESKYKDYIHNQIKGGFKDEVKDHAQTGFIIRNMKHPRINELNESWYSEIQKVGIQCQIMFFFIQQKFPDIIKVFTEYPFEENTTLPRGLQPLPITPFSIGGINLEELMKHIPFMHLMAFPGVHPTK